MNDHALPQLILMVGGLIALSILIKPLLGRLGVPPVVGFLALGVALRGVHEHAWSISQTGREVLSFLSEVGVVVLLFRVGLESNLRGLLKQLRCASLIWVSNVLVSGAVGFLAARYVLGLEFVPTLVVATAMTATSVGIPSQVWREADAIDTPNGERFLDVAELDDISGVVLVAMLFSVLPAIQQGGDVLGTLGVQAAAFFGKLLAFLVVCTFFSLFVEERFTRFCRKIEPQPDTMLLVAAVGFVIAALAGILGFSVAIGAFFAGLAFSRDPKTVWLDASLDSLYDLFTPFFFIGVGFAVPPAMLPMGMACGAVLLVAAVAGKMLGTSAVARLYTTRPASLALGLSMVPRAEITLLIMQKGLRQQIVSERVFAGMMVVSLATCLAGPLLLRNLLRRRKEAVTA